MTDTQVTELALQTMMLAAKVAAPILLTALLVGFLISLFQAATKIQSVATTIEAITAKPYDTASGWKNEPDKPPMKKIGISTTTSINVA